MSETISNFWKACLHCIGSKDSKVPRHLGEAKHASERNEVLHYDFMFVRKSEDRSVPQHILVIKDDLPHYVELCPAATADHFTVADAVLEWYKRFNRAEIHVSYRETHFKNSIIAEFNRVFQTDRHFTTAYSPQINGAVERVNREILKILKSLTSEFRMPWHQWYKLLPLIQRSLNNSRSKSLGDEAPITVFLGLPA
jgi:hypothetical protein